MPHAVIPEHEPAESSCGRAGTIGRREMREVEDGERLFGAGLAATPQTRKGRPEPTALAAQASSADNPNDPNYKGKTPTTRRRSQRGRALPESLETGVAGSSGEWDDSPPSPLTPPPPSEAAPTPREGAPPNRVNAVAPASNSRRSRGLLDGTTAWLAAVLSWAGRRRPTFWQAVILKFLGFIFLVYALLVFFDWATSTRFYIAACAHTKAQAARLRTFSRPIKKFAADATRGALSSLDLVQLAVEQLPLLALFGLVVCCGLTAYRFL